MTNSTKEQSFFKLPEVTKDEYMQLVGKKLMDSPIRLDALKNIDASKFQLKYVWGYRYTGTFDCNWSCQVARDCKFSINSYETEFKQGTPISGDLEQNRFDIVQPIIDESSPNWLKTMALYNIPAKNLLPYKGTEVSEDDIVKPIDTSALEFWVKYGNGIIDRHCLPIVNTVASNPIYVMEKQGIIPTDEAISFMQATADMDISGIQVENYSVKSRNNLTSYGEPVLLPYYVLDFEFENNNYFIVGPANDSGFIISSVPLRKVASSPELQAEQEMPEQSKKVKWMKRAGWLAILIFFITNLTVTLVYLIAWAAGTFMLKKNIKDRAKQIKKEWESDKETIKKELSKQLNCSL